MIKILMHIIVNVLILVHLKHNQYLIIGYVLVILIDETYIMIFNKKNINSFLFNILHFMLYI